MIKHPEGCRFVDAFLRSKLWFNGPAFLGKDKSQWSQVSKEFFSIDPDNLEIKRITQVNVARILENPISKWNDRKRTVAWLLKLKGILNAKLKVKAVDENVAVCQETNRLSVKDLVRAEQAIFSHVQQQHFKTDMESLQREKSVKTSNNISSLDPFFDGKMEYRR